MSDTTDTRTLGPAEVVERLLAVIDAHPDNVNPMGDGLCRYTHRKDRDRHCLIGQLAADQGWKVPGPWAQGVAAVQAERCEWPVTDDAARLLNAAQAAADNVESWAIRPLPWSLIRDDVATLAVAS